LRGALIAYSLFSVIASALPAGAAERGISLQVMGGWTWPLSGYPDPFVPGMFELKLGDLYTRRESMEAAVGYTASRAFAVLVEVERNRLAFKRDNPFFWSHPSYSAAITEGRPATILFLGLSLKGMVPLRTRILTPFVIGGAGLSKVSYMVTVHGRESVPREVDPTGIRTWTTPLAFSPAVGSFSVGLGADIAASHRVGFSAEWRYHRPFTPTQHLGEREIESTSYFSTRAGVTLRLH
jgi:hypothetical protein